MIPSSSVSIPWPVISFDAAGTLIQVIEPVARTYANFALRQDVHVEEASLKQAFGRVWGRLPPPLRAEGMASADDERSWWRVLVAEVFNEAMQSPLPPPVLEPLFDALYSHFAKPEAWRVYEDVLPVLEDLSQGHHLCVLSNFDGRLRSILAGHGLDRFFKHIILSSEVGAAKPHPRMFETAAKLMNAEPGHRWHVGDDHRCDISGAEACGWKAFAVNRPERDLLHLLEKVRFKAK